GSMGVVAHSANPAIPRLPTALPASLSQEPKYSGIPTIIATMKTRSNSSRVKAPDQLTVSQPLSLVTDHAAMKGLGESSSGEAQVLMTTAGRLANPDLREHLRIATWNVLTLARTGYLTTLVREVHRLDIDIVGITEARLKDNGNETIEGYTIYHSGGSQSHRGV